FKIVAIRMKRILFLIIFSLIMHSNAYSAQPQMAANQAHAQAELKGLAEDVIDIVDLDVCSDKNKKIRKDLQQHYHTHPILGFVTLRTIVEEFANDTVHVVLQTPPKITGFFKDWIPAYPPISSIEFQGANLI